MLRGTSSTKYLYRKWALIGSAGIKSNIYLAWIVRGQREREAAVTSLASSHPPRDVLFSNLRVEVQPPSPSLCPSFSHLAN